VHGLALIFKVKTTLPLPFRRDAKMGNRLARMYSFVQPCYSQRSQEGSA
jgi:hypothetical protein